MQSPYLYDRQTLQSWEESVATPTVVKKFVVVGGNEVPDAGARFAIAKNNDAVIKLSAAIG